MSRGRNWLILGLLAARFWACTGKIVASSVVRSAAVWEAYFEFGSIMGVE